jgi:hypothetical protein
VLLERRGRGPCEADEGIFNRRGLWIRRRQPEDGIGVAECLVDDRRVVVRALDNLEVLADVGRESRRVTGDDAALRTSSARARGQNRAPA